jgi:hypothetical protein
MYSAAKKCCSAPIRGYQCWNYCKVEEAMFPTWLGFVRGALNISQGGDCQRADQSPLLTKPKPPPVVYAQPHSPLDYQYLQPNTRDLVERNTSTSSTSLTGAKNATKPSTTSTSSTDIKKNGSKKASELSMSGTMCVFLVLSTLAL